MQTTVRRQGPLENPFVPLSIAGNAGVHLTGAITLQLAFLNVAR